jgi:hypothetical protein
MTTTEQIADAITAALTGAGLAVRLSTESLYSYEDLPVIVLVMGSETARPTAGVGYVYWDLSVSLLIGADGDSPTLAPESVRAQAHAALYADRTLGGVVIDLTVSAVNRHIDADNPALGIAEAIYKIQYRQLEGQL